MAAIVQAAMRGYPIETISAATTGNGIVVAPPQSFLHHTVLIKGGAGVASGAIQVETADDPDYSGTWAQVSGGPVTVVASAELAVQFEGLYKFLRTRVSTTIASGTTGVATVNYVGAP